MKPRRWSWLASLVILTLGFSGCATRPQVEPVSAFDAQGRGAGSSVRAGR